MAFASTVFSIILPLMLGRYTAPLQQGGLGLTETQAGLAATAEMLAIAIAGSIAPMIIHRSWRVVAGLSVAFAAFVTLLSAGVTDFAPLLTLRILAGLALGVCMAAGAAGIVNVKDPERCYTAIIVVNAVAFSLSLAVGGLVAERFGAAGLFIALAAAFALVSPFVRQLRFEEPHPQAVSSNASPAWYVWAGILVVGLYNLSASGLYALTEMIARQAGFNGSIIGAVIGCGPILGIAAAAIVSIAVNEKHRFRVLIAMLAFSALAAVLLGAANRQEAFVLGYLLFEMCFWGALPLMLGFVVRLDRSALVASLQSAAILYGSALAPSISTLLNDHGAGFSDVGKVFGCIDILCIVILMTIVAATRSRLQANERI
ncbi:MFS transporter [Escherichia coli]|nr:MFS transporter [Escherichia coli]